MTEESTKAKTPAKTKTDTMPGVTATAEKPAVTNVVALDIAFPATRGGGQPAQYPFDSLEVGQVFGVKNKTKRQITNSVSIANKKYRQEILGGEGQPTQKIQTRHFIATDVTPEIAAQIKSTDLEGSTVLVKRDK